MIFLKTTEYFSSLYIEWRRHNIDTNCSKAINTIVQRTMSDPTLSDLIIHLNIYCIYIYIADCTFICIKHSLQTNQNGISINAHCQCFICIGHSDLDREPKLAVSD